MTGTKIDKDCYCCITKITLRNDASAPRINMSDSMSFDSMRAEKEKSGMHAI